MNKNRLAILIPAFNEDKVLEQTLLACRRSVARKNIYVVDDGSDDNTSSVAKKYTDNVLRINNSGKASALNIAVREFDLVNKFDYIFLMDADTYPQHDFTDIVLERFGKDGRKISCVTGRVKGIKRSWYSMYRNWEYHVAHLIHKRAQTFLSSILVAPGCATVYSSSILKKIKFPTGTLTEDMDFTFLLHRKGFGQIAFEDKAVVYTIDPQTLEDYTKQLTRWYTGFWQVVKKHKIPWGGQMFDLEVGLLGLEGLFNGLLVVAFGVMVLGLIYSNSMTILAIPLAIDLFLFFIPTLVWSSIADRDYKRILFIPHFYFLRFLGSILFLKGFFDGYLSHEKKYIWDSKRIAGKEVA